MFKLPDFVRQHGQSTLMLDATQWLAYLGEEHALVNALGVNFFVPMISKFADTVEALPAGAASAANASAPAGSSTTSTSLKELAFGPDHLFAEAQVALGVDIKFLAPYQLVSHVPVRARPDAPRLSLDLSACFPPSRSTFRAL